ncbi:hypothetical protein J7T55_014436 [Diaporthe amygdali]|uniref:uncharacterized protein n=1 Tax=Phomopsis amygdali TaxID=1214568 RepID=UPI0022FE0A4E|nr:uncharacterized protein J7T55_014436 [Diaporthe amygdali]KAJ0117985.1 hypothetical protein J7T55_014436 [Diaporthe amygdali]
MIKPLVVPLPPTWYSIRLYFLRSIAVQQSEPHEQQHLNITALQIAPSSRSGAAQSGTDKADYAFQTEVKKSGSCSILTESACHVSSAFPSENAPSSCGCNNFDSAKSPPQLSANSRDTNSNVSKSKLVDGNKAVSSGFEPTPLASSAASEPMERPPAAATVQPAADDPKHSVGQMKLFDQTQKAIPKLPRDGTTVELLVLACKGRSTLIGMSGEPPQSSEQFLSDSDSDDLSDDNGSMLSSDDSDSSAGLHPVVARVPELASQSISVVCERSDIDGSNNFGMGIRLLTKDGSRHVRGTCGGFLQLETPNKPPRQVGLMAGHLLEQLRQSSKKENQETFGSHLLTRDILYPRSSGNIPRHDWALFDAAHLIFKYSMIDQHGLTIAQKSDLPAGSAVVVIRTSRGAVIGTLSSSTSAIMLSPDHGFVHVRMIFMNKGSTVTQGDSGAWVVDPRLSKIYGHIIATNNNGHAYMVPLHSVITEMKDIMGINDVSLAIETDTSSQTRLGVAHEDTGQTERSIQIQEPDDQPDHLVINNHVETLEALAETYLNDGRAKEAILLLEEAVSFQEAVSSEERSSEEDQSRLASQHKLGKAYLENGRVMEAIEVLEKVVEARAKVLDQKHSDCLESQHNLAIAYTQNGRTSDAIRLLENIVATEGAILARSHIGRLTSQHQLAGAYLADGQISEAIKLLEYVVAVKTSTLEESDPHLLASQIMLSEAYLKAGRASDAVKLLEGVVAVADATFSEHDRLRIDSRQWLDFSVRQLRDLNFSQYAGRDSKPVSTFQLKSTATIHQELHFKSSSFRHLHNLSTHTCQIHWLCMKMGIREFWPIFARDGGEVVNLFDLASEHIQNTEKPYRIAVDLPCWMFHNLNENSVETIRQNSQRASNPIEKAVLYRMMRFASHGIQVILVSDGPQRPAKKNRRTTKGHALIIEKLNLLERTAKAIGIPWWQAPGEAEAECAQLQRLGIVDAVWSEDSDTFIFRGTTMLRFHLEADGSKSNTHAQLYRMDKIADKVRGMDWRDLVLFAIIVGGDYSPEGLPQCGPRIALEAIEQGLGISLVKAFENGSLDPWRQKFKRFLEGQRNHAHPPVDFPSMKVLQNYIRPKVSSEQQLRSGVSWNLEVDNTALRAFITSFYNFSVQENIAWAVRMLLARRLIFRNKFEELSLEFVRRVSIRESGNIPMSKVSFLLSAVMPRHLLETWPEKVTKQASRIKPYEHVDRIECDIPDSILRLALPDLQEFQKIPRPNTSANSPTHPTGHENIQGAAGKRKRGRPRKDTQNTAAALNPSKGLHNQGVEKNRIVQHSAGSKESTHGRADTAPSDKILSAFPFLQDSEAPLRSLGMEKFNDGFSDDDFADFRDLDQPRPTKYIKRAEPLNEATSQCLADMALPGSHQKPTDASDSAITISSANIEGGGLRSDNILELSNSSSDKPKLAEQRYKQVSSIGHSMSQAIDLTDD